MQHIDLLQGWLEAQGLSGIIISSADEFQNEYVPESAKRLQWVTGFSGSAGQAVVLRHKAALFVDSRYVTQALRQTSTDKVEVCDLSWESMRLWFAQNLGTGELEGFVKKRVKEGVEGEIGESLEEQRGEQEIFGIDSRLHTLKEVERLREILSQNQVSLHELKENPVDHLWVDRPETPKTPIEVYSLEYAGTSSQEKRDVLSAQLRKMKLSAYLVTAPEEVAWLLNIRATDLPAVPVALSYALLEASGDVTWFVEQQRIPEGQCGLVGGGVRITDPATIESYLTTRAAKARLGVNLSRISYHLVNVIQAVGSIVDTKLVELAKAKKNSMELIRARAAQEQDGLALIRFLSWLQQHADLDSITELDAAHQVTEFRRLSDQFRGVSFAPISASGPNAALPHYQATADSALVLSEHSIYLLDSGGQYYGGTTDVTRTIALGEVNASQRCAFTCVLKGHIALAMVRFPQGTKGYQLDVLARQFLWQQGKNYGHGTGHGVGSYLSVHEGPCSISSRVIDIPLAEGMIFSNEPGYYLEGEFGIRIENLMVVKPSDIEGFLEFETITYVPIDPALVEPSLLTNKEIAWLQCYHRKIALLYMNKLHEQEKQWLKISLDYFNDLPIQLGKN